MAGPGIRKVLVVGGGVVGSSAAYHLARRGIAVELVDRGDDGQATAAGLVCGDAAPIDLSGYDPLRSAP